MPGNFGIAHVRWATHGDPSKLNSHPHVDEDTSIAVVHNGIIENYQELKLKLSKKGYTFGSQTDTEAVVKLIDYYYKKYQLGPVDAIAKTMVRVRGSYALAVMFKEYPNEIWVARKDSPMIIGTTDSGTYVASDVPAILKYTRNVYYIGNLEMACLTPGKAEFYNLDGEQIEKELVEITWNSEAAEKGGYEHFMMKEIYDQPQAIRDTLLRRLDENRMIHLDDIKLTKEDLDGIRKMYIVACGTAYHAGLVGKYAIEKLAKVPVEVDIASEFRYRNPIINDKTLAIFISQSGETADTISALKLAKENSSEEQIRLSEELYKNALIKLQGFHSAFGEDAQIYSREEIVKEFQIFDSNIKDSIDKKILDLLQDNGRITVKEITQTISLTAPAVSERIKRMEKEGIIEGYTAIVNPKKIGRTVHAIINVSISPQDRENLLDLVDKEPMVVECYHVTGDYSYLVKVDAKEIGDLERLIIKFQKMGRTSTQIILSTPIERKKML